MKKYTLTKMILGASWLSPGVIFHSDGSLMKSYVTEPLSSGGLEEGFCGPASDNFFTKLADLLTKLPNLFTGQIVLRREMVPVFKKIMQLLTVS
jgi:hypothetical protein